MTVDDKVCDQVSMTMFSDMYPREVIKRCVQHSEPWCSKVRRVRLSAALTLVCFVIAMALWSRRNQCQVLHSLVGKLSDLHPAQPKSTMSDSGLSGRRKVLGSQCMQALLRERCQVLAEPSSMRKPRSLVALGSWPLMARCSTLLIRKPTRQPDAAQ